MIKTAWIHIWGELVGAVAWDENTGYATFEYENHFRDKKWDLAPYTNAGYRKPT